MPIFDIKMAARRRPNSGEHQKLEVESSAEPEVSLPVGATRNQKYALVSWGRACSEEVYELGAVIENACVQDIIHFDRRSKPDSFGKTKFATDIKIKEIHARPAARVPGNIPVRGPDKRHRKLVVKCLRKLCSRLAPNQIAQITVKVRFVGADVIQIAIDASSKIERSRAAVSDQRRKAQFTKPRRRFNRSRNCQPV